MDENLNDLGCSIIYEECRIINGDFYRIENNSLIETSIEKPPVVSDKHLYLVRVSGIENFSHIFNYLLVMESETNI